MASHDERDRAIEHLLPQVLGGAASTPCVDGETLAAWSEGALRASEAVRVETHVADCARCQAMLGAFVRITPAPIVTESMWQRWRLGWLLPLATAAAAVMLWAVITGPTVRRESQVTLADARRDSPPATPAAPPPPPAAEREAATLAAPPGAAQTRSTDRPASAPPPQFADQLQRQAPSDAAAAESRLAKTKERDEKAAPVEAQEPLAARRARNEAPSEPAPAQPLVEQLKTVERVAVAPPAASPAPAPAAATPVPPPSRPAAQAAPPASPQVAVSGAAASADREVAAARMSRVTAPLEIPTPVASIRWRVTSAAGAERTTNSGATWVAVPGLDFSNWRAGSAPSADVCWLVGPGGRVFLSTDGRRFTRVAFPQAADLVAVTATDARIAAVTTADGRTFRTGDGGVTWTR